MFLNSLKAEWTKLSTTKGLWWNLVCYFVLVLGFLALNIYAYNDAQKNLVSEGLPKMPADTGMVGEMVAQGGGLILIIVAILAVTTEYGHKYAAMTFQAVPNRLGVALAKLLLMAVIAVVLSLIAIGLGVLGYRVFSGAEATANFNFSNDAFTRMLWVVPLYTVLLVLLAQAVAWIVRNSAGSIVIMLVWYMVLEIMVIPMLPKVGEKIHPYGPLSNLGAFFRDKDLTGTPWDTTGSLFYFLAWAVGLFVVGMVLLRRRDA
ncbi:ABC transporter permease [Corynebacterium epidermidicanis]|uniref:ABC-2 family transporter protein n=1 Tax=Corynebacterium epidermidicanis TaxID=1050174 RepID=A0A0G3GYT8_9CORY|nr:ABC transporter permease [Corynebacterium epidermidicanis]AKK04027.1 ABC-2 family transporter protein [Corynebacterium epidermidicanis]